MWVMWKLPTFVSSSDHQYYKGWVYKVNCNITVFEGKWRVINLFKFWMERRPAFHIFISTNFWGITNIGDFSSHCWSDLKCHISNFPIQNLTPFSLRKTSKTLTAVFNMFEIFMIDFIMGALRSESTLISWVPPCLWSFVELLLLLSCHDNHDDQFCTFTFWQQIAF